MSKNRNKNKSTLEDVKTLEAEEGEFEFDSMEENQFASDNVAPVDTESEEPKYVIPCKVELERPIKVGSNTLTELEFKNEMQVSFMEHMPISGGKYGVQKVGHIIPVISKMTGETMATIKQITFSDFQKCSEIVAFFT